LVSDRIVPGICFDYRTPDKHQLNTSQIPISYLLPLVVFISIENIQSNITELLNQYQNMIYLFSKKQKKAKAAFIRDSPANCYNNLKLSF